MGSESNERFEEAEPFLDEHEPAQKPRRTHSKWQSILPWALTAASWMVTMYLLVSKTKAPRAPTCPSYFPTDFAPLRQAVEYETREYTGSLIYLPESKRIVRNISENEIQYFGPPSQAIDDAWETLLHDEFPLLLPDEAEPFVPELTLLPTDNEYHFEPDMWHSLHCVNAVRRAIDIDYYPKDPNPIWKQEDFDRHHIDHCLHRIMQSIMCFGDLSPSPLYSWAGVPIALGKGSLHTCRKPEPVRKWVDARNNYFKEKKEEEERQKKEEEEKARTEKEGEENTENN